MVVAIAYVSAKGHVMRQAMVPDSFHARHSSILTTEMPLARKNLEGVANSQTSRKFKQLFDLMVAYALLPGLWPSS